VGQTFRIIVRLKGYIYRQRIIREENGYTTTLPQKVFAQRNFVAEFIPQTLHFIHKNDKFVFEPPFGGLSGIASWKARGQTVES